MIFTDKAAKEKIATLESRITELESDIGTKDTAIESLTADITAKDQTIAENVAKIAELTESHEAISAELATANTALETATAELAAKDEEIAKAKESAGAQATEILASIGQPEPLAEVEAVFTSHLDTFNKLTGHEATAYWKQHQKAIRAEMRNQSK